MLQFGTKVRTQGQTNQETRHSSMVRLQLLENITLKSLNIFRVNCSNAIEIKLYLSVCSYINQLSTANSMYIKTMYVYFKRFGR